VREPAIAVAVRTARTEDLDAIARLEEASFMDAWPREMLAYELSHLRALLLVASRGEGDPPSGYAAFRHAAGEAELLRLAVSPGERRRGIARALIAEGLERLVREGVQVCFLEVRMSNEPAVALYEGLGFARIGRRRGYYRDGSDALVFALEL
jgi:[ribosomal protein S18]-alanine N-acetyltransferase